MSKTILGRHGTNRGHWVGDGFPVRSLFSYDGLGQRVSPFLLLDFAGPHHFEPTETRRGVGQHPHRGFETVTIVYEGEVEHKDSTGNGGVIGPGDVQWMTAGGGILHEEYHSPAFARSGGPFRVAQLWVNLPARDKMTPAGYQGLVSADIPVVALPDGAGKARIIAGELNGVRGPAHSFSPINVWDVRLNGGAEARLDLPEGHNAILAVLGGKVVVDGKEEAAEAELVVLSREGAGISVHATSDATLLVLTGEPIDEPIVGYGPFVMNTQAEIVQAIEDFNSGRFTSAPDPGESGMHVHEPWPDLSSPAVQTTVEAMHLFSQVAGKIRLGLTPWLNHSWHVPFYLSARGLTTGWIPADGRALDMEFDLFREILVLRLEDGREKAVALPGQSVASFYRDVMEALAALGIAIRIDETPCEIPGATPFPQDRDIRPFDGEVARTYWRALLRVQSVFHRFRTRFVGKCSPIHLFWGSFDLAVTRFSGRSAPAHPGGAEHMPDAVARDGYFQEVASAGFWSGVGTDLGPAFYAYAYPAPNGYAAAAVEPTEARFSAELGEFLLPYASVRAADDPDAALMAFLQSTYVAAADLADWDRAHLERAEGPIGHPPEGT